MIAQTVYEAIKTVGMVVSIVFAVVAFFKAIGAKRKANEALTSEHDKMAANDAANKKIDEELKKMAKFRCDRCGAIDAVANAESVDGFDLCGACAGEVQKLIEKVVGAGETLSKAKEDLNTAEEALDAFLHGNNGDAGAEEGTKQ